MVCLTLLLAVVACSSQTGEGPGPLVFAATSLTDVLTEIGRTYESRTGVDVDFNFGGSQGLAQQIARRAPADLFIAAGEFPVSFLAERGLVAGEVRPLLVNELVVVTRTGGFRPQSMAQLLLDDMGRVAVANPELAPAGRYAREALSNLGLWGPLDGKLVFGADVRATLTYVETGNADAGLVYRTDAMTSDKVDLLDIVPDTSYSQILYPGAVLSASDRREQALEFLRFLESAEARDVFRRYGFEPFAP